MGISAKSLLPVSLWSGCQRRRSPPGWSLPWEDEPRAAWDLGAHTALLPSLGVARVLPDPKNALSPLFFASRAMSMDYWHISFIPHSEGIATSTKVSGDEAAAARALCRGEPRDKLLTWRREKRLVSVICPYLTPTSKDRCSSPPGSAKKQ